MPTLQIYDQLLQFPLFQGMSRDDLEIVAGHTRFGFTKMPAGKLVIKNGSACQQMYFLINGSVKIQSYADDNVLRSFCSWSQHSAIISVTRTTSRQLPT